MDTLLKILQTPIGTLLALAGLAIIFLAFFEVSKGTVKMRKTPKDGLVPAAIGAALILVGLFLNRPQAAVPAEPTPLGPTVSGAATEVSAALPTDTAFPLTEAASPTEPSALPTETVTSVPIQTLADGCIAVQTWQADSTDAEALGAIVNENNCWNLENLGFVAQEETLHILPKIPKVPTSASGIFTPISNQSIIEFKVFVNRLYIIHENNPAYISFSIAPQGNPMARQESARFKLQVKDTGNAPIIFFMLADTNESNGDPLATQHYEYNNTYDMRLELNGISMKIYINNTDTGETISIPSGPKVFYIGYNLPLLAGVEAEIKDITIDGVKK
jgi:hypothetical protein